MRSAADLKFASVVKPSPRLDRGKEVLARVALLFTASRTSAGWPQYILAFAVFALVSLLNLWLNHWIGYQAIALVYLLSVVLLALLVNRAPVVFGTILTAVAWNYFFAPPRFAFNISDFYDNMMLVVYFVVTLTVGHLTTRLREQRDAELQAKLLAESERLGRTLLNSVSHELRTPIAAINSAAHTLRSSPLTPQQQNLASEIDAASSRLNRVVQSLLSAARIQSGQIRANLDWCDVRDLVRVALRGIKQETAAHAVTTDMPANLRLVKADFVLLEQALANLVGNAAAHTPPGTAIQIVARNKKGFLVLSVADAGPGIPAAQLDRIFDSFHRGPGARPGGMGLGLAIVKGFIEAQGGRVEAANRATGGAIFTIHLPLSDEPDWPKEVA